jgi:hypothetical protein
VPHWWIKIASSPPLDRRNQVRAIVARYTGAQLVGNTIFYEKGVTTSAWALVKEPTDQSKTTEMLSRLQTQDGRPLTEAAQQEDLLREAYLPDFSDTDNPLTQEEIDAHGGSGP